MSDAAINGLAGAIGGMIAQLLTYPLQAINTRQQTDKKLKNSENSDSIIKNKASRNAILEMYQILKTGGIQELYRGLGPSLVGTACSQGVYYYFYQLFRSKAIALSSSSSSKQNKNGNIGMLSSLIVAALAGCVNVLLTNPIWVVVTRMQTQSKFNDFEIVLLKNKDKKEKEKEKEKGEEKEKNENEQLESKDGNRPSLLKKIEKEERIKKKKHQNALEISLDLYNEAGLLGFWKGVLPTLIMVSNPSIQFMLYESLQTFLKKSNAKANAKSNNLNAIKSISAIQVFGIGALAKLGATVVTYPLLVVKSRLQAKQKEENGSFIKYSGTLDTIQKMLQYEGIGCFYKGMRTKIVQSVFAAAVLFMIKEEIVKFVTIMLAYYAKPKRAIK